MLRIPKPNIPAAVLEARLSRAGFAPAVIEVNLPETEGGGVVYEITGSVLSRKDKHGGPASVGEEDRAAVEAVLTETKTRQQDMVRVRELRTKPTMTTPELTEAVKLLLKYVEEV